jgi:NAD(P)-dependent dehydrogenase (short-subunit alcohol dehydrogenase family)
MTPSPQRVALVTGGGTGIGAAISAGFADAGYAVVLGQSSARRAADSAARLAAPHRRVTGVGADLSTAAGTKALVAAAVEAHGRIDVLVNNAGVTGPAALAAIEDYTDEQIDAIFDVNLKAPLRLVRTALPHLSPGSVVVNVSSVAATAPQRGAAAYGASKAGLNQLTQALALELAPRGIRCVWIAPGDIRVEREETDPPVDGRAGFARYTPLGRRGDVADVAAAVLWLCGPDAGFVTGTGLVVDGGWSAL